MKNRNKMADKKDKIKEQVADKKDVKATKNSEEKSTTKEKAKKTDNTASKIEELEAKLSEMNDKHLRLQAEFDNYRRRTLNEKMDLIKSGGEDVLSSLLPVMDNFERAITASKDAKDIDAVREGIDLIYTSFKEYLNKKGVKEIEAVHKEFDTDYHEAMTKIPAPDKKLKGKVIDVIEKGYMLNEKVIRFAKVVVGE